MTVKVLYYLESNDLQYHILGAFSVAQTRKVMPDVEIVQLAGSKTEPLIGVDRVHRRASDWPNRSGHIAQFHAGEPGGALCLDVDTLVFEDVSDVFNEPFDLAVSNRHFTDGFLPNTPYNSGVVFSRSETFWKTNEVAYVEAGKPMHDKVFCSTVNGSQFRVLKLDGAQYNYIPQTPECNFTGRKIVHFTGSRKAWMKDYCLWKSLKGALHALG